MNWSNGRIGLITASTLGAAMLSVAPAWAASSATRTSSFAYDGGTGLLTSEVVEPNTQALRLATSYTYDAYGNKVTTTVSGVDIATRTATNTYDAQGRFVTKATNALGQSESWTYDPRFGKPASHTGPNGLVTTWSYDGFGRKTLEVRPDGTRTSWNYAYCSGVNGGSATCPANGAFVVTQTPLAADGATQNGPKTTAYLDIQERTIASDTQGFDAPGSNGSTIRTATQYDALGRVAQVSRPYFLNGGTPQWTVNGYDLLGRAITQSFPDGSTKSYGYNGLITTSTNQLGKTRTVTRDSQGQIVATTDALGDTATFVYDPFGNLIQAKDPVGNVSTAVYDARGRKTAENDPDRGAWTYAYDTAGELISQTDAKGQVATMTYDVLGRMTARTEADLSSSWVYDTAAGGIGKLAQATTGSGYGRTYVYDSLGRVSQVSLTADGATNYVAATTYDAQGRVASETYPSGLVVQYSYTALGYLSQLTNGGTGAALWTATARDQEMHLTAETAGNGIPTLRTYAAATGFLLSVQVGQSGAISNQTYGYDAKGNLLSRADSVAGLTESFTYDALSRLLTAAVTNGPTKSFAYDATGNLTTKSDVGTYSYPAAGSPRPHAVQSIAGTLTTSFAYDANGNEVSGAGRTIAYASFNLPSAITTGTATESFSFDSEHQRLTQTAPAGTTLYLSGLGVLAERLAGSGGMVQWTDYVQAEGRIVAIRFARSDGTVYTRYPYQDHLGSTQGLTDDTGAVAERDGYDAWGKRRYANGTDDPAGALTSQTTRGFTGQEELPDSGLVHLNGRVYDPYVARFTGADPMVARPFGTQGWDRYSYVGNNPLKYTDPSGYCFMGCFWKPVFHSPIFRAVAAIAAAVTMNYEVLPAIGIEEGSIAAVAISGAAAGGIQSGSVKGMIIGAASAVAFDAVGSITEWHGATIGTIEAHPGLYLANIAGHAAVGCAMSAAGGGSCESGAMSAGLSAAAGPLIGPARDGQGNIDMNKLTLGTVESAVLGGTGSVLGGGKFMNGAVTGSFGYLYNETAHLGVSVEVPGFISQGLTAAYHWLTGDTSFMQGNGLSVGVVWQYPGAMDKSVPYDIGLYGQVSAPLGEAGVPSLKLSASGELGVGSGAIHGTFDGLSYNYNAMAGEFGGTATFSPSANGDLSFTGLALRLGSGLGVSANASFTGAATVRDGLQKFFGN